MKRYYLPIACSAFLLSVAALSLDRPWVLFLIAGLGGVFVLFARSKQSLFIFLLILFSVLLGFTKYHFSFKALHAQAIPSEVIELEGYVRQRELRPTKDQRLTIIISSTQPEFDGQSIQLLTYQFPTIQKGDLVSFRCLLERPEPFDGFAYDRYLASQGVFIICRDAYITKLGTDQGIHRPLEWGRIKIAQTVESLWPRPVSSLVTGLILGTRESFPQSTLDEFRRAGVTHIIALSGFNITILILFIEALAVQCYIPKRLRFYLVSGGIIFFTIFVGAGASITRAAVMGSLVLVSRYWARSASPLRLMLVTAAVMVFFQPFILVHDLGFQLSFLSTIGLLYLTSFFEKLFFWLPSAFSLRESMATTFAATLSTLPLILFQFGQLSVVSPFANMLILPIIPWLMALGGLTVLVEWIFPLLSYPFLWATDAGAQYVLNMSKFCSSFSWAAIPLEFSVTLFVFSYLLIFGFMVYASQKD